MFTISNLSLPITGSEDKSIIVWDTKRGRAISSLQLHIPILNLEMSTDSSRIAVHLLENHCLPIVCLHNTPATYVKMPTYIAPAKEIEGKCLGSFVNYATLFLWTPCYLWTHWGWGHLNCLNAHSRGLNNLNQLLYWVSLKIYNKFVNYFFFLIWNFQEILTKEPSSAWGCDTSGNIPPCAVELSRSCRCTEFHFFVCGQQKHGTS